MGYWARKVREIAEDLGLVSSVPDLDKPYLTQKEAARFCCVSLRQFREKAPECGLFPFKWMGKLVYRRDDLVKAMETERWRAST